MRHHTEFGEIGRTVAEIKADNGLVGHGSWIKWVKEYGWVTWITSQYLWPTDPWSINRWLNMWLLLW